jgi:hypothetical protein
MTEQEIREKMKTADEIDFLEIIYDLIDQVNQLQADLARLRKIEACARELPLDELRDRVDFFMYDRCVNAVEENKEMAIIEKLKNLRQALAEGGE